MWAVDQPYQEYLDSRLDDYHLVCPFGPWCVEAASDGGDLLLLVVNHETREVVRCHYPSLFERSDDIEMLLRVRSDGDAGAAVLAWLKPVPPSRSGGAARPLPPDPGAEPPAI